MDIKIKPYIWITILGILFLGVYACDSNSSDLPDVEDCENYNYEDCNTVQPFEAEMQINFSISSRIKSVPFEVYKGYLDDDNLYFRDTAWDASMKYLMPVDEYWTVVASYYIDGKTIKVVDGGHIKARSANVCDSICWSVNDLVLDVVIK